MTTILLCIVDDAGLRCAVCGVRGIRSYGQTDASKIDEVLLLVRCTIVQYVVQ